MDDEQRKTLTRWQALTPLLSWQLSQQVQEIKSPK
jgi:hypothetical protein